VCIDDNDDDGLVMSGLVKFSLVVAVVVVERCVCTCCMIDDLSQYFILVSR
jgi:hypothetical protein